MTIFNSSDGFMTRQLGRMFPGFFTNVKHDYYRDFGFPTEVTFDLAYGMYRRHPIAKAAIGKTASKCWVETPWLLEYERDGSERGKVDETKLERAIRQRFMDLRVWARLAEADRRSMVGAYSGVILRLADGRKWNEPVERVRGGLDGLLEVIPAWEGQLSVSKWDEDETSATYGEPLIWEYDEQRVSNDTNPVSRKTQIHASRVVVWSQDGTINNQSMLEPGFNDLITMAKIAGAGGEGFWKNARSAPVLQTEENTNLHSMAKSMGVSIDKLLETVSQQVDDYQQGFDKVLMLQGLKPSGLNVNLPSPEHFFSIALQGFAASIDMPMKILVGTQTGERASTEDARDWALTCNSRRANIVTPAIMQFVHRLEQIGVIRDNPEWFVDWNDLTESTQSEKLDLASKMATINNQVQFQGEVAFTAEEIREIAGYEPLADQELPDDEDEGVAPVEEEVE